MILKGIYKGKNSLDSEFEIPMKSDHCKLLKMNIVELNHEDPTLVYTPHSLLAACAGVAAFISDHLADFNPIPNCGFCSRRYFGVYQSDFYASFQDCRIKGKIKR